MKKVLEYIKNKHFTSLNYKDLSQWEVGKAVIKEAMSHWEPLDFLHGIDEQKKEEVAVALDNVTYDILSEKKDIIRLIKRYDFNCCVPDDVNIKINSDNVFDFQVDIFPLIRRVVQKVDNFNYEKFIEYLDKYSFLAINYDGYNRECDIEAEFIAILSKLIIEMFNKNANE